MEVVRVGEIPVHHAAEAGPAGELGSRHAELGGLPEQQGEQQCHPPDYGPYPFEYVCRIVRWPGKGQDADARTGDDALL